MNKPKARFNKWISRGDGAERSLCATTHIYEIKNYLRYLSNQEYFSIPTLIWISCSERRSRRDNLERRRYLVVSLKSLQK
eukprot:IDg7646t1